MGGLLPLRLILTCNIVGAASLPLILIVALRYCYCYRYCCYLSGAPRFEESNEQKLNTRIAHLKKTCLFACLKTFFIH